MGHERVWWVVAWDFYYPCGGLNNVKSTHSSETEAAEEAASLIGIYDSVEVINVSSFIY